MRSSSGGVAAALGVGLFTLQDSLPRWRRRRRGVVGRVGGAVDRREILLHLALQTGAVAPPGAPTAEGDASDGAAAEGLLECGAEAGETRGGVRVSGGGGGRRDVQDKLAACRAEREEGRGGACGGPGPADGHGGGLKRREGGEEVAGGGGAGAQVKTG